MIKINLNFGNMLKKQMSKYEISESEFVTELCSGPHYMKIKYPKDVFLGANYKEFEGCLMPVPQGYDYYLKKAFGDYMKLPSIEAQKPHHDIIYMNLNCDE